MQLLEVGVVARDVAVLAADHPERRLDELAGDLAGLVAEREAQRLGEERVAGEQRDALAERDVRARPSAALVVVVQRGQVVVDERERVHQLERGGSGERRLDATRRRLRHREAEDGPDALAARLERVAERLFESTELRRERESSRGTRSTSVAQLVSRAHRPVARPRQLGLDLPSRAPRARR